MDAADRALLDAVGATTPLTAATGPAEADAALDGARVGSRCWRPSRATRSTSCSTALGATNRAASALDDVVVSALGMTPRAGPRGAVAAVRHRAGARAHRRRAASRVGLATARVAVAGELARGVQGRFGHGRGHGAELDRRDPYRCRASIRTPASTSSGSRSARRSRRASTSVPGTRRSRAAGARSRTRSPARSRAMLDLARDPRARPGPVRSPDRVVPGRPAPARRRARRRRGPRRDAARGRRRSRDTLTAALAKATAGRTARTVADPLPAGARGDRLHHRPPVPPVPQADDGRSKGCSARPTRSRSTSGGTCSTRAASRRSSTCDTRRPGGCDARPGRHRLRRRSTSSVDHAFVADPYPYFEFLRAECPVRREPHHDVVMVTGLRRGDRGAPRHRDVLVVQLGDRTVSRASRSRSSATTSSRAHRAAPRRAADERPAPDARPARAHRAPRAADAADHAEAPERERGSSCGGSPIASSTSSSPTAGASSSASSRARSRCSSSRTCSACRKPTTRCSGPSSAAKRPGTRRREHASSRCGTTRWSSCTREFTEYIEDRRADPTDDVLTGLATATFPDGSLPDVIDVVRIAANLFAAGQETTVRLLAGALQLLGGASRAPGARCAPSRDRIPNFVEETLRFESPVKGDFRLSRVAHDRRRRRHPRRHDGDGRRPAPRTATRVASSSPTSSSPTAPTRASTSRSGTVSTPARARRWPGPRRASASSASSTACATSRSRRRSTAPPTPAATSTRPPTSCAVSTRLHLEFTAVD